MKILLAILILFPSITFSQNDSTKFYSNLHIEFNLGVGRYHYSDYYLGNGSNPPELVSHSVLTADADLNINFRNDYFKLSSTLLSYRGFFDSFYYGNYKVALGGNLFAFAENHDIYFGPNVKYGRIRKKLFEPRFDYIGFGWDLYIKNFHAEFYYDKIINTFINTNRSYKNMIGINIGYSFNLESFRKK